MEARRVTWGGLKTVIVESESPPKTAVVLCHGFGAPGTDLVNLAPSLANDEAALLEDTAWVFPAAPISLAEEGLAGGLAWWPIDMAALMQAIQLGRMRDLRKESPPELPAAREHLFRLLDDLKAHWGLDVSRVILGGFSQGAMLATDVSLHLPTPPAGLCVLSGTLLCEPQWRAAAANRTLNVFQSHGTADQILPYENAEALRELLTSTGSTVEFVKFSGYHEIPRTVTERLAGWLLTHRPQSG